MSVAMRVIALALACLACASHGRRVRIEGEFNQPSSEELQQYQSDSQDVNALAKLLMASSPSAGWRSSPRMTARHYFPQRPRHASISMADEEVKDEDPTGAKKIAQKKKKKKDKSKKPKEKIKVPLAARNLPPMEKTFCITPPSNTELLIPGLSVFTVVGLIPFGAAVSRQVWTRYKFTNRRMQINSGFQGSDSIQVIWREVTDIKWLRRYRGVAGDVVFTLLDGSKIEVRHIPEFERNLAFIMNQIPKEVRRDSIYPDQPAREYYIKVNKKELPAPTIEAVEGIEPEAEKEEATTSA